MMIDPRISEMFKRESPALQFVALLLVSQLSKEQVDAAIEQFAPRGVDRTEVVAGKPFQHWWGKSREQIANEVDAAQLAEIDHAFTSRGMKLDGEPAKSAPRRTPAARTARPEPAADVETDEDENAPDADEGDEVDGGEVKIAGRKLDAYDGKTDDQLLKLKHVGPATVLEIRRAQAKRDAAPNA